MIQGQIDILVYSENIHLQAELLAGAKLKTTGKVALLVMGRAAGEMDFENINADVIYQIQDPALLKFNPEPYTDALAQVIKITNPRLILFGATKQGLEVSARLGERLGLGIASWCVDFNFDESGKEITAQCMIYSGIGLNRYRIKTSPAILTVAAGVFETDQDSGKKPPLENIEIDLPDPKVTVLEEIDKLSSGTRLEDYKVIVDVGQGFENRDDLKLAEELADLLGGAVSCSRPLSSERDWFPEWIGLSGAQLSPRLCFTIGVSGAIQHMIGIRGSDVIVAVNNDEHAGVHLQADYGVVADLYDFLPALIEVLKEQKVGLA